MSARGQISSRQSGWGQRRRVRYWVVMEVVIQVLRQGRQICGLCWQSLVGEVRGKEVVGRSSRQVMQSLVLGLVL